MKSEYLQAISAITALVAVIVGPLVTLYVAKRQIRANTITGFRQKWISELRDELSSLAGVAFVYGSMRAANAGSHVERTDVFERLLRHSCKLDLMLNPCEKDHAELCNLLERLRICAAVQDVKADRKSGEEIGMAARAIVDKSQAILKREWERVKRFD